MQPSSEGQRILTIPQIAGIVETLHPPDRMSFLARLVSDLSVAARADYPEAREGDKRAVARLCCFNELINDVSAYLSELIITGSETYPRELFFGMLEREAAKVPGAGLMLERAATRSLRLTKPELLKEIPE